MAVTAIGGGIREDSGPSEFLAKGDEPLLQPARNASPPRSRKLAAARNGPAMLTERSDPEDAATVAVARHPR